MTIYFEDLAVGDEWASDSYEVTEAEIIEFAEQYDPQWFHTDPERAAEESIYGSLIAAGFHTAAISTRLFVDCFLSDTATLGGKGIDKLRWHEPVRPGDRLSIRAEILDLEAETDSRGLANIRIETSNGDGEVAFSMIALVMFARRGE
ncbi:MaoC family dehydratase [Halonotius terrestris]|uniref:MaoC family dehydratase n=1 Tax=Halonotius terrestris TaxID=2487750 RepID=A0A8J8PAT4_9EURY|nr:MaoC family dehydratase [Halonotius terrestris]TQQ79277.1 MaoC family dehydratase [Halonotius terrestris]